MLKNKIEQVLRDFEWHDFGIEGFGDIQDPNTHQWPPELADQIVKAITEEISEAMTKAVEYGAAMGAAFQREKQ